MAVRVYLEGHFFEEHRLVEDEIVFGVVGEPNLAFIFESFEIKVAANCALFRAQPEVAWYLDASFYEQDSVLLVLIHILVDQLLHVVVADGFPGQLDLYPELALGVELGLRVERVPKRKMNRSILIFLTLEFIHF